MKRTIIAILALAALSASAFAAAPKMTPDDVTAKVKADFQEHSPCSDAAKITKVETESGAARYKAMKKGGAAKMFLDEIDQKGKYVKAFYFSKTSGRTEYDVYGPVDENAKADDFKQVVGLKACYQGSGD